MPRNSIPVHKYDALTLISPNSSHPPNYIYLIYKQIALPLHIHKIIPLKTKEVEPGYQTE